MTGTVPIRRLWAAGSAESTPASGPPGVGHPLDLDGLVACYGRPDGLRVNFVTSVDGAVAIEGRSAGLSGGPDKRVFAMLRMLCDALVVGAGTLRDEEYRALTLDERRRDWRRTHGLSDHPVLVVVSRSLRLDPGSAAFTRAPVRPIVLTTAGSRPPAGLADVCDLVRCGDDEVDLAAGLAELRRRGHRHLLSEGGPRLLGALTAADLVDEVCLTVAPLLAGPGAGRITAGAASPPRGMILRHVLAADDGVLMLRHARRPPPER